MPPPGGAGGADVGFIKEPPDPWEVRRFPLFQLHKLVQVELLGFRSVQQFKQFASS